LLSVGHMPQVGRGATACCGVRGVADSNSSLYLLYDSAAQRGELDAIHEKSLAAMEPLSAQITSFSHRLFGGPEVEHDYSTFSPYVPLSLYQSAVVQSRLWRATGDVRHQDAVASLKEILGHFNKRWSIAGELHRSSA
jgi:hypothetical protein